MEDDIVSLQIGKYYKKNVDDGYFSSADDIEKDDNVEIEKLVAKNSDIMERKSYTQYSKEVIEEAMEEYRKTKNFGNTAKKFNIARSTLQKRWSTRMGSFSVEQEKNIVTWILIMARAGFSISKQTLMHSVQELAVQCGVSIKCGGFNKVSPGRKWYENGNTNKS
ncbi:hypothetical protein FQA39_LY03893 [Lamprigera yunnana]|nr:hypothetical protein FQA39_LY03893 [Lamprigera yunnana]